MMRRLVCAVSAMVIVAGIAGACLDGPLAQEARSGASNETVEVSQSEVEGYRIGRHAIIRAKLNARETAEFAMQGITVHVKVGPDGILISATGDSSIPPILREQAEAIVRDLRYRPFERNGHTIFAAFDEVVSVLPPELQPLQQVPFPAVQDWNSLRITLERTSCFGACPAYRVEVHGDGTVLYNGRGFVAILGQHRGSVPQQNVQELLTKFREPDYYSLRDEYIWPATDLPTYETSIEFDGHLKKVKDYAGLVIGMPMTVSELENSVDQLAKAERWTKGDADTVRALREENWDFKSPEAARTLARVAQYGTADAVRDFIAAGVPPNGQDEMRLSPLVRAASRGDIDMLAKLLEAGAGKEEPQRMEAALAAALRSGKGEAVLLLLQHGANSDLLKTTGKTMLMGAAASGVPETVQEILNRQPDVNARGDKGWTALMEAVGQWHYGPEAPPINRAEVVRLLLEAGADVDAKDEDGNTALIEAGWDADAALLLIKAGADVNAQNVAGITPLINAPSADVVRVLLENGADVSARDKDGKTALDLAKQYSMKEKVAALEAAQAMRKQ